MRIEMNSADFLKDVAQAAEKYWYAIYRATEEACDFVHGNIPRNPPASRKPYPFKTFRQRLFVIRSIQDGTLKVPYRRTNQLNRSITTKVTFVNFGGGIRSVVGLIGTNMRYAAWVISNLRVSAMDAGPQAKYHSGVWYTLQEEVQRQKDKIRAIFKEYLIQVH